MPLKPEQKKELLFSLIVFSSLLAFGQALSSFDFQPQSNSDIADDSPANSVESDDYDSYETVEFASTAPTSSRKTFSTLGLAVKPSLATYSGKPISSGSKSSYSNSYPRSRSSAFNDFQKSPLKSDNNSRILNENSGSIVSGAKNSANALSPQLNIKKASFNNSEKSSTTTNTQPSTSAQFSAYSAPQTSSNSNTKKTSSGSSSIPKKKYRPYTNANFSSVSSSSKETLNYTKQSSEKNSDTIEKNEEENYEAAQKDSYTLRLKPGLCLQDFYASNIRSRVSGTPDYNSKEHEKAPEKIQYLGFSGELSIIFNEDHIVRDKPGTDLILNIPVPSLKGAKKMATVYGLKDNELYPLGQIIMGSKGSGKAGFDLNLYELDSIDGIVITDLEVVTDDGVKQFCSTSSLPNAGFAIDSIELIHYFVQKNKRDGDT